VAVDPTCVSARRLLALRNRTMTAPTPMLKAIALFALLASGGVGLVWQADRLARADERQAAAHAAAGSAFGIEQQLSRSLSATYALASIIRQHGAVDGFEALAAEMLPLYGGLSSLQLAPGGVVRQIYPLVGNEPAMGHDLLRDPDRRFQARAAIDSRQLTVAGPFELRQGGVGLVGRLAVFLPDAAAPGGEELWGLVTVVISVQDLLGAAQLRRLTDAGYLYELTRLDPETGRVVRIAGSYGEATVDAASIRIKVPNGEWTLGVASAAARRLSPWLILRYAMACAGAAILSLLAFFVIRQPETLRREVAARTAELASELEQRRRAEEALVLTQLVVDRAVVAIAWVDGDDRLVYANQAFARLGGGGLAAHGRLLWEAFPPITAETWRSIKLDLDRGSSAGREVVLEGGATPRSAHLTLERLRVHGRELVVVFARDVTAERRGEEQLRQAQKLDAIGQLAGGIAHDFNNLLTGILGHAAVLTDLFEPASEAHDAAQTITTAARRGAELTKGLLGFARRQQLTERCFDVHDVLREVSRLLGRTLDKRIRVVERFEARPSVLVGDAGQLQQAVLNLAVNARDAMEAGGELTLETQVVDLDAHPSGPQAGRRGGPHLAITVADTGHGIPLDLQERIFEPFYTTKEVGQGTGMGLAMVYGFARSHGGTVRVTSAPGQGARFTLSLPLSRDERGAASAPAPAPETPRRGSGLVLVVDDDDAPRSAAEHILRHVGYDVITAPGGAAAVDLFRARAREVSAVLLDLSMPGMDGEACYAALREIDPAVRVVLTSGLDRDGRARALLDRGVAAFVPKPYLPADLAEAMGRVTGGAG
jgi:two-component system, cell cycle sensor histidine kinase and response regulator CckA